MLLLAISLIALANLSSTRPARLMPSEIDLVIPLSRFTTHEKTSTWTGLPGLGATHRITRWPIGEKRSGMRKICLLACKSSPLFIYFQSIP
ncbi:hypothetical protein EBR21_10665 [bacterium]|nr:hypothetical protein [bacterium]